MKYKKPCIQNGRLRNFGKRFKNDKKWTEKIWNETSKVFELLILPYTQHWKLGNLENLLFTSDLTEITIKNLKTTTNEPNKKGLDKF